MNYHVYNTPGLILGTAPAGEASQYVQIFTRNLGLVRAHAQNVRNINSKLRYALDAPARATVSLVRGKNVWRLISAVPEKRFFSVFRESLDKQHLCARIFSLLKRLLAGEEANPDLFAILDNFLGFLETDGAKTGATGHTASEISVRTEQPADLKNAEAVAVLRILHNLGYLPENDLTLEFGRGTEWNQKIISAMSPRRRQAVETINESLRATGL